MSFCIPVLRNWCKNLALVFKTTVAYVQGNLPHLFLQKMKKKRCPRQGKTNNNKPNKKIHRKKAARNQIAALRARKKHISRYALLNWH